MPPKRPREHITSTFTFVFVILVSYWKMAVKGTFKQINKQIRIEMFPILIIHKKYLKRPSLQTLLKIKEGKFL